MNQNFIDLNFEDQFNHISELSHSGQFEEAHKKCEFLHSHNKDHILVKFCLARLKVSLGKKEDWLRGLELFDSIRGHGVFGGEMLSQKKTINTS